MLWRAGIWALAITSVSCCRLHSSTSQLQSHPQWRSSTVTSGSTLLMLHIFFLFSIFHSCMAPVSCLCKDWLNAPYYYYYYYTVFNLQAHSEPVIALYCNCCVQFNNKFNMKCQAVRILQIPASFRVALYLNVRILFDKTKSNMMLSEMTECI